MDTGAQSKIEITVGWFWKALAVPVLAFAVYKIFDFPTLNGILVPVVLAYGLAVFLRPKLWLSILPALIPLLGFALWSGRFFFDEFDILLLVTLAALLWRRGWPMGPASRNSFGILFIALLALTYALSTAIALVPAPEIGANSFNTYYSPYNALRVGKGAFWILLLAPYVLLDLKENAADTRLRFARGMAAGIFVLGILALWERGVLAALLIKFDPYLVATQLLDFTSRYRITGLFADMNVGGAAIDGFVALALPAAAMLLFAGRGAGDKILGAAAISIGAYAALVTFTRGLYLGLAVAACLILWALYRRHKQAIIEVVPSPGKGAVLALGVVALAVWLFYSGGLAAVVVVLSVFSVSVITGAKIRDNALFLYGSLFLLFLLAVAGNYDSLIESKWQDNSPLLSIVIAAISAGIAVLAGLVLGRSLEGPRRTVPMALTLGVLSLLVGIAIPALGGVRVLERFATVSGDSDTRILHWRRGLSMMDGGLSSMVFGQGVGSFPREFFLNNLSNANIVNYRIGSDQGRAVLELGQGDFNMTQKIPVRSGRVYHVRISAMALGGRSSIGVRLCEKNILYGDRWVPSCSGGRVAIEPGDQFEIYEFDIATGGIGSNGWTYWPTTLLLRNGRRDTTILLNEISITDGRGAELVRNGSFDKGLDDWLMIRDFGHLEWHIKNAYLHVFFEQGLLGVAVFVLLVGLAVRRVWPSIRGDGAPQGLFLAASLAAFFATGLFEAMLDAPRISWLLFMILLLAGGHRSRRRRFSNPPAA